MSSFDVRDFGARGDGSTDDAGAIMAAHNALPSTGGALYFPAGQYRIASQLALTKKVLLHGDGNVSIETATPACAIIKKSTMTTTAIVLTGDQSCIRNLGLLGESGNTGDGIQIKANGVYLDGVAVMKMGGNGIRIGHSDTTNCNSWQLHHVLCRANGADGCQIHSNDTVGGTSNANAGTAIGLSCLNNSGKGLRIKNAWLNTFTGTLTEANTGEGIYLETAAKNNVFVGGDQEGNNSLGVQVRIADAGCLDNAFFWINDNNPPTTLADAGTRTVIVSRGFPLNVPGVPGRVFTNAPGDTYASGKSDYFSLFGGAAERVRIGWAYDGPTLGLTSTPAQMIADNSNTLSLCSREQVPGKVKLLSGASLAGYLLLDHDNTKVETNEKLKIVGNCIELDEMTEPAAPAADRGRLFLKDNGSGKTQLCIRFSSGASQVIATQP